MTSYGRPRGVLAQIRASKGSIEMVGSEWAVERDFACLRNAIATLERLDGKAVALPARPMATTAA